MGEQKENLGMQGQVDCQKSGGSSGQSLQLLTTVTSSVVKMSAPQQAICVLQRVTAPASHLMTAFYALSGAPVGLAMQLTRGAINVPRLYRHQKLNQVWCCGP